MEIQAFTLSEFRLLSRGALHFENTLRTTIKLINSLVRSRFINVSRINKINKAMVVVSEWAIFRQSVGAEHNGI